MVNTIITIKSSQLDRENKSLSPFAPGNLVSGDGLGVPVCLCSRLRRSHETGSVVPSRVTPLVLHAQDFLKV